MWYTIVSFSFHSTFCRVTIFAPSLDRSSSAVPRSLRTFLPHWDECSAQHSHVLLRVSLGRSQVIWNCPVFSNVCFLYCRKPI